MSIRRRAFSALLFVCLAQFLHAASVVAAGADTSYGPWRSCKIGGGGYIQNVVLCPSNPQRLYTYVDVGGVFRSDDGGRNWRMLHGNLYPAGVKAHTAGYEVRGLLVDPRDDNRIIMAAGSQWDQEASGIYVSNDAGGTWRQTLAAGFLGNGPHRWSGFVLTRHPAQPDTVVAASVGGGVWRSTDNGATWQQGGARDCFPTDIHYDRANPNRLWLCAASLKTWFNGKDQSWQGGFYRSEDGGLTWRKVAEEGPYEVLQDPVDARVLYGTWKETEIRISRDGGDTWQPLSDGLPIKPDDPGGANSEHHFNALAAGPNFVLTATSNGTFYRLNSGTPTWHKIERQGVEEIYEGETWFRHKTGGMGWALGSITVDPRNANHWFFTDWFAICETSDAGVHWSLRIDGIEVTVLHTLLQDRTDPAVVHLGMADNGYFRSTDGGIRFGNDSEGISNNIKSIALSPQLPSRLYAVGPRTWEWEANQVFVSLDRGAHWTRSPMEGLPDMTKHNCNTIAVEPGNPYSVYLAVSGNVAPGDGGLYHSMDGGKKWLWAGDGLPNGKGFYRDSIWGHGAEIALGSGMVTISTNNFLVYHRDDAAQPWQKATLPVGGQPSEVVADPDQPRRFFVAYQGGGVLRSDDGGATWTQVFRGNASHIAVDGVRPNRIAAGTDDGVILSNDGGTTWTPLDKRLPYRVNPIVAFAGERLIVGTGGNGAFWMPLSAAGSQPTTARPVTAAELPGTAQATLPKLTNLSMSEGAGQPAGWNLWTGEGKLQLTRDTTMFHDAPASLSLASQNGHAYGTASQTFTASGPFQISGFTKATGKVEECLVAIQVFDAAGKQIDWINLATVAAGPRDAWQAFSRTVELPATAAHANLVLTLKGDGQAWLDDLKVAAAPKVWLD